jgi:hypothetical protein
MPDWAVPNGAVPYVRSFRGVLTPFLGGPDQLINRLGTRFGLRVTLPPMPTRDKALTVQSRLLRAMDDRLRIEWPQPDFDIGTPGAPLVAAAVTSGMGVAMKGFTPGATVHEGQFFAFIHGGRRYIHIFAADGVAASDGTLSAVVWPMLRTTLSINDVVELDPKIEGIVNPGDEMSWEIAVERLASFTFTVAEAA